MVVVVLTQKADSHADALTGLQGRSAKVRGSSATLFRDLSKFTGYLGRFLGKICLKKVRKKSSPPYFVPKKESSPPFFVEKK